MASVTIPQLPTAAALDNTEFTIVDQHGKTCKVPIATIFASIGTTAFGVLVVAWWQTLPTTDPGISGAPWRNNGVLAFSP